MRILILEDEPLIAMDLEDIVNDTIEAECILVSTVEAGLRTVGEGIDFAMLDFDLGRADSTSLAVARRLMEERIPFCFVSGSLARLPEGFAQVPRVAKPFRAREIARILPHA